MAASLDQACKKAGRIQYVPSELSEYRAKHMWALRGAVQCCVVGVGGRKTHGRCRESGPVGPAWGCAALGGGGRGKEDPYQIQGERSWGLLLRQACHMRGTVS